MGEHEEKKKKNLTSVIMRNFKIKVIADTSKNYITKFKIGLKSLFVKKNKKMKGDNLLRFLCGLPAHRRNKILNTSSAINVKRVNYYENWLKFSSSLKIYGTEENH